MAAGIHSMGVTALRAAYRAGRVSVVAAVDHYLARIDAHNATLNAFTHVDAAGARRAATGSAARYDAGTARPLEGVPIAIKANIDVAGMPVHGGFGAMRDRIAPADAAVVARLRDAGAIILGMLNMHEGALGATTDNSVFGQCQNPHRPGYTPGGSSGGSGAAVAAGLCAAALGTDTLGSVRIPAAYCGVTGLKPTHGLVPAAGLMLLAERWDCIGPLARSVADTAALMAAMAPIGPQPAITTVATLGSSAVVEVEPAVAAAMRLAETLLRGLGLAITRRRTGIDHHRVRLAGFVTAAREADARFGPAMATDTDGFSLAFRSYLAFGRSIAPAVLDAGQQALDNAAADLKAVLLADEAILLPTTPQAAFPHTTPAPVSQADFTALANIAGLPAISVPAGWTADGLPVGVQIVGRAGADAALLDLAARLEAALGAYLPPTAYR